MPDLCYRRMVALVARPSSSGSAVSVLFSVLVRGLVLLGSLATVAVAEKVMPSDNKIEPIVLLLVGLVVLFSCALIGVAKFMSSDGQTFQVIANLDSGFAGALLMRVKPKGTTEDPTIPMPPTPSTVTTRKTEETTARSDDK
jgi:hypothetical protein